MATYVPPGVVHHGLLKEVNSGGAQEWVDYDKIKLYTNAFIKKDGKLLLGYKKRGIGHDLYNGFGGKVEPGETPAQAALRELKEECGIEAPLRQCGMLFFVIEGAEHAFHIHVFTADEFSGTVTDTEEMRPEWFAIDAADEKLIVDEQGSASQLSSIPYERMWADDIHWLPLLLKGRTFAGRADFASDGSFKKWWFGEETQ